MNISKISRSLVVAVFVVFIVFLSFLNIKLLLNNELSSASFSNNLIKLAYVAILVLLVIAYVYIKDKLNKLKVKRKIAFIYRYIYMGLVVIITSFISLYISFKDMLNLEMFGYIVMSIIISIVVKKIIFNVSKSDILSVLAMFASSMKLYPFTDKIVMFNSLILSLTFFATLFIMQILIDELKQRGVKTKKYIILSVILGIAIGISLTIGINILVYIILCIGMLFLTDNLDKTHISFPKKFMASLTQLKRETFYRIERININKLIVSLVVIIFIASLVFNISLVLSAKFEKSLATSSIVKNFLEVVNKNNLSTISLNNLSNYDKIENYMSNFLSTSKTYYMVLFVYIIGIELLAVILKRRYDTKSTVMKLIFILLFMCNIFFDLNIYIYQPLFTVLLVLIAIVNTSNIYLNREERIKMLVA
ncbi:MAG: hypothetical protein RSB67_03370 [Clostridia bacterium]